MSTFKIVVLGIFGFFLLVAVLIFSGLVPGLNIGSKEPEAQVVLWGTIPAGNISGLIEDFNRQYKPLVLIYIEKNKNTFDRELVEALASGVGPDVIMLPQSLIYRHADKVYPISYETFPERDFRNTFVEEAELYLTSQGTLALPLTIDPMVMYFNRDILSKAGIALPPQTWEEVLSMTPRLVLKDAAGNITQSAVAFGEFKNVIYAKDIIALLTMQAGSPIVARTETGYRSVFGDSLGFSLKPADEAVRYFTDFSNPVQPIYSWNKGKPSSRDAFISGTLAFYFGYASELFGIQSNNPHLNFDVAPVPQVKGSRASITLGNISGLSITKASRNPTAAFRVASLLSGQALSLSFAQKTYLPPPRRDILSGRPSNAYMSVFFTSALMSRGFIDPSPDQTSAIFGDMVENVVSGRLRVGEAVMNANSEFAGLFIR